MVISLIVLEAVQTIDALFEIERAINGFNADQRKAMRQEQSAPLVAKLHTWTRERRAKVSRHNDLTKAWTTSSSAGTPSRASSTTAAYASATMRPRALRGIALGKKSWLFARSNRGGERAAVMFSLIVTAKMNDIDPQARLAGALARIADDHPVHKRDQLMPWSWAAKPERHKLAA